LKKTPQKACWENAFDKFHDDDFEKHNPPTQLKEVQFEAFKTNVTTLKNHNLQPNRGSKTTSQKKKKKRKDVGHQVWIFRCIHSFSETVRLVTR